MLMLELLLWVVSLLLRAIVPLVGLGLSGTHTPIVLVLLLLLWLVPLVCRLGRLEGLSLGVSLLILLHFFPLTMIINNYTRLCGL